MPSGQSSALASPVRGFADGSVTIAGVSGSGCGSCADWDTEEGAGALELPEGGAPEAETCPLAVQAQRHITAVLSANRALHKRFVMPVNLAIGKTRRKEANKKKRRHLYRRSSLIFCFVPYPVFTIAFQRNYPYTNIHKTEAFVNRKANISHKSGAFKEAGKPREPRFSAHRRCAHGGYRRDNFPAGY